MKDNKILFGTALALLLLLTTGLSYAYFSTAVKGNDNAKDMVVEAGTLKLTYTDGQAINAQNIKPGWSATKEVSVKNNGTCESISQTPISDMTIAKKISIESGIAHKYTFTILFKETNVNQNYNQGKEFNGVLGIEESKGGASPVAFSTDSWDTIVSAVKSGDTSVYKVGDTKEVNLGTTYGTHTLRIANMSTPSECSTTGFSQTTCGFVLEFADIIVRRTMNDTATNVGGWPASSIRTFINSDIYNVLPSEIKNAIIDTTVISGHGSTSGEENFTSTDKLYLLSPKEIYTDFSGNDTAKDLTRTLDYYTNIGVTTSNRSGAMKGNEIVTDEWWLRTPTSTTKYFMRVSQMGSLLSGGDIAPGIIEAYVSLAFRIG